MHIRTIRVPARGKVYTYYQLRQTVWDRAKGQPKEQVLYHLGPDIRLKQVVDKMPVPAKRCLFEDRRFKVDLLSKWHPTSYIIRNRRGDLYLGTSKARIKELPDRLVVSLWGYLLALCHLYLDSDPLYVDYNDLSRRSLKLAREWGLESTFWPCRLAFEPSIPVKALDFDRYPWQRVECLFIRSGSCGV